MENRINNSWDSMPIEPVQRCAAINRLYFSSIAYIFMHDLRRLALKGTELEGPMHGDSVEGIENHAQIRVTVRRVWIRMAVGHPYKEAPTGIRQSSAAAPALLIADQPTFCREHSGVHVRRRPLRYGDFATCTNAARCCN
jgi:hypothetical protein